MLHLLWIETMCGDVWKTTTCEIGIIVRGIVFPGLWTDMFCKVRLYSTLLVKGCRKVKAETTAARVPCVLRIVELGATNYNVSV